MNDMDENSFYIIGLSYKKADVITRSKFSLSKKNQENLLLEAKSKNMDGLLVVSTCNRVEIIGFAKNPFELISLLCKYSKGTVDEFSKVSFVYKNKEAVKHFITIATGLDSQILGDYEIVGQLKDSFQFAKKFGTVNAYIERLYNVALQASKETKNKTSLSSGTTTVSYAAIQYIKDNIKILKNKNILIYGLGNIGSITAKSCAKYLQDTNITITNRSIEKSINLANAIGVKNIDYHNLDKHIQTADVLIVATGANKPIITSDHFNNNKKQLIIDLSIPKNVDNEVKFLENKTVIDVDILSQKTKNTIENRKKQIPLVEAIIEKYKKEFLEWLGFRKSTPAINNLKQSLESIQKDALHNYLKKHQNSNLDEAEEIASQIVNKIVSKFAMHLKAEQTRTNQSIQVMNEIFV
ncbi:MAG: glutamyl-tRNA reductase [Flavobacteriaceae bacterium]|nr:glutamyl-tRNA reductase [Flavobacteriaceae bacterium]